MSSVGGNIPNDVVGEILPHLSIKSLSRFQTVCVGWKEMIKPYVKSFKNIGSTDCLRITTIYTATSWLYGEMRPGETVRQTLERFAREVPDCADDFNANMEKLQELQDDVDTMKVWQADIEEKTMDEVEIILDDMRAIRDRMMPTFSDEED